MKKLLIITNITTAMLLAALSFHYQVPSKIYNKVFNTAEDHSEKTPVCSYELQHYDFHYINDTQYPKIVMLGNSLIRHGTWAELLERTDIVNKGISGDNLNCLCERLHYLKGLNAKIWFIEGGINDLPQKTPDYLFEKYKELIQFVKAEGAIPVINFVFYISPKSGTKYSFRKDYKKINSLVLRTNQMLRAYANENNIDYIDMNSLFGDKEHVLKNEFTTDGVHLNSQGYTEWATKVKEVLEKYKI